MQFVKKSDDEWKNCLSKEEYDILRRKKTEAPFTGKFIHVTNNGDYVCAACGNLLFKSKTKFDSGTGWPSFYDAVPGSVVISKDYSLIIPRDEVSCAKCGGHLGHVFNDGPKITGKRYCINSAALKFKKKR
ncbi:Peptide methionine sulfoxide reductase MsrB [Candidatus Tiddalikarchaeum anstoanum]|nr:Peptide methionine sulfoxide reductase MsrB [Candidatus Tiddalikarchaeum anstoanum]